MTKERVTAYLSHSYRHADREINDFFWKLFWTNGITFAVDPESEPLSIPYLELMMKRSAAFVGIVTRRPEQQTYQCSPFMVFEHGLAVRAQKAKLLFVESGISKHFFPDGPETLFFSRQRLPEVREAAERMISTLGRRSDSGTSALGHGLGQVGLLIDEENPHLDTIRDVIKNLGFSPISLDTSAANTFSFALQLDQLDFIVLDTQSAKLPTWVYPFISGRFMPTIKLRSKSAGPEPGSSDPLWETSQLLDGVAQPSEVAVSYDNSDELVSGLAAHAERLREERILFRSLQEGSRYFRSLGRRREQVFISNTAEANEFVRLLSTALKRENIRHFQYRYQNDVTLASLWRDELPSRVRSCRYFLPLISERYWESQYCVEEYEIARVQAELGQVKIIPYYLDRSTRINIPEQGRDLSDLTIREQARLITADLDALLTA